MKTKFYLAVVLPVVAGVFLAGKFFSNQPAAEKSALRMVAVEASPAPSATDVAVSEKTLAGVGTAKKTITSSKPPTPGAGNAPKPKEPLRDPAARAALGLVGADPNAEQYWLGAIFDSSLPDNERENLMEDLNEDGLSDPKHPGAEDLPLIVNRLVLIEAIVPQADEFMLEHLGEAYKDLNNLLAGKPVQ